MTEETKQPNIDPSFGGEHGKVLEFESWAASQRHVKRNVIPIVTRIFSQSKKLQIDQFRRDVTQALLEVHAVKIAGLSNGISIERSLRGASNRCLTWLPSQIEYTLTEKYGMPLDAHFRWWMQDLVMKAFVDNDAPLSEQDHGPLLDLEDVSVDMLFIEPDPTHTVVVGAWFAKQMHPIWYSGMEGERDIGTTRVFTPIKVRFDAEVQYSNDGTPAGEEVRKMAEVKLTQMAVDGGDRVFKLEDSDGRIDRHALLKAHLGQRHYTRIRVDEADRPE